MSISVFGKYIRSLRKTRSLSVKELSVVSGITEAGLSSIESGRSNPNSLIVQALSRSLKVPCEELMIAAGIYTQEWVGKDLNRRIAYEFTILKVENACLRDQVAHLKEAVGHLTKGLVEDESKCNCSYT